MSGKHAVDHHYGIVRGSCAAQTFIAVSGEVDLIAARRKQLHELLGRLRVVLDGENAGTSFDHHYALLTCSDNCSIGSKSAN
jgi:hypothetical protein